jgi:hypothetical protein
MQKITTTKHTKEVQMSKILCFFGWHNWSTTLQDYLDEYGTLPLDAKISSKSKCSRCGITYKGGEQ